MECYQAAKKIRDRSEQKNIDPIASTYALDCNFLSTTLQVVNGLAQANSCTIIGLESDRPTVRVQ